MSACESCGKPATGYTADDVPLCAACGRALAREARVLKCGKCLTAEATKVCLGCDTYDFDIVPLCEACAKESHGSDEHDVRKLAVRAALAESEPT